MKTLLSLVLVTVCLASAHGESLVYELSGVLPEGSSDHPLIPDGDSWTATFRIDTSTIDTIDHPEIGEYRDSAIGTLEFSSGFSLEISSAWTMVGNDTKSRNGTWLDGVQMISSLSPTIFSVYAGVESAEPGSTFLNDALPISGTTFATHTLGDTPYLQLHLEDRDGGWTTGYNTGVGPGTKFAAYLVPEPANNFRTGLIVVALLATHRRSRDQR